MIEIYQECCTLLQAGQPVVLATVFEAKGSAPRVAGARMLVRKDGSIRGTIGGGRLEHDAVQLAITLFEKAESAIYSFDLTGSDVAGMEVTINGKTFPIAGVVKSEDDFATAAALDAGTEASSDPTGVQSASKAMIYMSYAALNAMAELPIDCYEIVLPDPVSGFAKKLMTEKFPVGEGVIVQNTGRFSLSGLISVIGKFGKRVMTTNGVIYPYWENAARMAESYAALLLILGTLFGLMPAVCLTIVLVKLTVREIKRGYYKAAHAIEDRVEENKRKHYVSGGI